MDSLALTWLSSGKKPGNLYKGSHDALIQELKIWIEHRKIINYTHRMLQEDSIKAPGAVEALQHQPGEHKQKLAQLSEFMQKQIKGLNRSRELDDARKAATLQGLYLVASVRHRGITWIKMPCLDSEQVDADICAIVGGLDKTFDAQKELNILEERERRIKMEIEIAANDAKHAAELAKDPIPGVKPRAIGVVASQARQEITKNPLLSMEQAVAIASDMHLGEGVMEMGCGRASPDTIAKMVEKVPVAEDASSTTTVADAKTPATKGIRASSGMATTTSTTTTGSSSHEAVEQADQPTISKAKKKNDARKARKKALFSQSADTVDGGEAAVEGAEENSEVKIAETDQSSGI